MGSTVVPGTASTRQSQRTASWAVALALVFIVTRYINYQLWLMPEAEFVQNDVGYYRWAFWCLQSGGLTGGDAGCVEAAQSFGILGEYPVPAVWILQTIYVMSGGPGAAGWVLWVCLALVLVGLGAAVALDQLRRRRLGVVAAVVGLVAAGALWYVMSIPQSITQPGATSLPPAYDNFFTAFVVSMLLIDAAVAVCLFRAGRPTGALFWILFMAAAGSIVWFRFDIITAALVALACLWLVRHPAVSGALVGLGAAIKLWPALLILPMVTPDPFRASLARRRLIGFVVVGVGLGIASLLTSGWTRSASPLEWQSLRGLQQESVPALPLVFLRAFVDNPTWTLELSKYKAIELFGPGVDVMLMVSTVLTALSFVLTAVLTWRLVRAFRAESGRLAEAIVLCVFAILLATMVANKVLSTQYVQWLAGPIAALLVTRQSAWLRRPLHVIAVVLLGIAALSQYTYPWGTFGIMGLPNAVGYDAATLILRNLLLVGVLVYAVALAWRATARHPDEAPVAEVPTPVHSTA